MEQPFLAEWLDGRLTSLDRLAQRGRVAAGHLCRSATENLATREHKSYMQFRGRHGSSTQKPSSEYGEQRIHDVRKPTRQMFEMYPEYGAYAHIEHKRTGTMSILLRGFHQLPPRRYR